MPPSDNKEKVENEENEKNDVSDTKSNKSDKSDKSDKSKDTPKKGKGIKKASGATPDKMDPVRFQEGGVNFKAKLIGLENVPDARGDKMCQDAMQKLKGMVKTAKAHKPKITINVSLEGLKIIDDISQNVMHHHAVHKISFISRDITDARAFGYIYGLGEGKHQFFGIKTDKPAEGLVLTLRDLFQVVFEMKKQEVEAAKARKSAKDDEKSKNDDKATDNASPEKPVAQEVPYDAGSADQKNVGNNDGDKPIAESNSSADLLNLENQLLNLEVTFEQVDAFSAAAPTAAPAAAAPQFPVSFEQNFGNPAMGGAQRDPFSTPTLAPPPNYGTQQQQQKPPMQQQQLPQATPFPQPQPGDPFNTDPFGQGQFTAPAQPAPQQQASFAAFPPQGSLPVSPQHAAPMPMPGQIQMPGQVPQQQIAQQQVSTQQQQQQPPLPQQDAFGAMPVQKDPFKDDPFFTENQPQQTQTNDRYAVFSGIGGGSPAAQGFSTQQQSAFGGALQPMQPMKAQATAPSSPHIIPPQQKMPVQGIPANQFSDLANLAEFTPANKYVDRSQFFKKPEPAKPAMNTLVPGQPQNDATPPAVPARQQFQGNPFAAQNQWPQ